MAKFVAIPFVTVYFLILYAYSAKVLANFSEWPKGEVTWMVIGFSFFGYLAYAFSYGLEKDFAFVKKFRKALPFAIIPQIAMLAYAIWLRIAQYDLTANRYFVVVFGIMLLSLSAYFAFSKGKRVVAIPVAVVAVSVLVSIGPWSVFSLPAARQEARLVRNLEAAGMMSNGKISTPAVPLSRELSIEIYEGADYLVDYEGTIALKEIFPEQYAKADKKSRSDFDKNVSTMGSSRSGRYAKRTYRGPDRYELFEVLEDDLGIRAKNSWGESHDVFFEWSADTAGNVKISGYSQMFEFETSSYKAAGNRVEYDPYEEYFTIVDEGKKINLSPFISVLRKEYPDETDGKLGRKELTFDSESYRIVFNRISVKKLGRGKVGDDSPYWYASGYVLKK